MKKNLLLFVIGFIESLIIIIVFQSFRNTEPGLVDISKLQIIYTEGTTQIYNIEGRVSGVIYPYQMMFRDSMLPEINNMAQIKIIAWIWHENIRIQGDKLELCNDENFRQVADCMKMGRLKGGSNLIKIYEGKDKKWFLFSFNAVLPRHSFRSQSWYNSHSSWFNNDHSLSGPDLTYHGQKAPTHDEIVQKYSGPFVLLFVCIVLGSIFLFIPYRMIKRTSSGHQLPKIIISYVFYLAGAGVGLYLVQGLIVK